MQLKQILLLALIVSWLRPTDRPTDRQCQLLSCPGQLKNSLMFKLLSFWRKYTPFIDQKCTYEKVTKILGRALPPPHLDKIQKNRYFLKPSLID